MHHIRRQKIAISIFLIFILISSSDTLFPIKKASAQGAQPVQDQGWKADVYSTAEDDSVGKVSMETKFEIIFPPGSQASNGTATVYSTVSGSYSGEPCAGPTVPTVITYLASLGSASYNQNSSSTMIVGGDELRSFTCTDQEGKSWPWSRDVGAALTFSTDVFNLTDGAVITKTEQTPSGVALHYEITFHRLALQPSNPFQFQIITPNFANVTQGQNASIPITVSTTSSEPEEVTLSATDWSQSGISTYFEENPVTPDYNTIFSVQTSCSTPAGNYLFTISGSAQGTSSLPITSQQAVTVTVLPNPSCNPSSPSTPSQPSQSTPSSSSSQSSTNTQKSIPSWVRNNAKWWASGQVSDADFIKGIQYLAQQGIITVPPTQSTMSPSKTMPVWVKNTAKWWALGQVSDADFIKSIQYLVQNGIISVQTGTTTAPIANALVLNSGQISNRYSTMSATNSDPSIAMHFWEDATGSAASWVSPQHIDFGTLYNGQSQRVNYTITVPQGQQPGNYELIWNATCAASSGGCHASGYVITIIVTTPSTTPSTTAPAQYNTFHNHGISFSYPSNWTVQDQTQNSTPNIKIVSGDSSITMGMLELSTSNRFGSATGQQYLNQLIASIQNYCNNNSICSNLNLTNSKVVPSSFGDLYVVTFNLILTEKNGAKINYAIAELDMPTSSGTWLVTAQGSSTNYSLHSQEITNIVSSIALDQT